MAIDLNNLSPEARRKVLAKLGKAPSRSKYGAIKDSRGSIEFDSRKEAARFDELMLRLKAGQIRDLRLQVQFTLKESYITPEGERIRAIRYIADFVYDAKEYVRHPEGELEILWRTIVEDVKSKATKTAVYRMKKKLMHEKFGITVQEV